MLEHNKEFIMFIFYLMVLSNWAELLKAWLALTIG